MITFPCTCGHRFEVPDDQSGASLQCPDCKRLNDVPLLSELDNLTDDGTLRLLPRDVLDEEDREQELVRAFRPSRQDFDGNDYDLRLTFEQIKAAGAEDVPLEMAGEVRPGAPKYDPVTGELIEPMAVKGDEHKRVIPISSAEQNKVLQYERPPVSPGVAFWRVPGLLLIGGGNLAVWLAIFLAHLFSNFFWVPIGMNLWFAAFLGWFAYFIVGAHFSGTVEDMGPMEKDELPTPLRGMAFGDDIWKPFVHFFGSLILCYLPALVTMGKETFLVACVPLAIFGTFIFPAVFLTQSTSGHWLNLRPDRIVGVIRACGAQYIVAVLLWIAAAAVYFTGAYATAQGAWAVGQTIFHRSDVPAVLPWFISYPLLVGGIYLMHLCCWHLGLLYRAYYTRFPWTLQRHIYQKRIERVIPPRRPARNPAHVTGVLPPDQRNQLQPPSHPTPVIPIDQPDAQSPTWRRTSAITR